MNFKNFFFVSSSEAYFLYEMNLRLFDHVVSSNVKGFRVVNQFPLIVFQK